MENNIPITSEAAQQQNLFDIPDIPPVKPIEKKQFSLCDAIFAWICMAMGIVFTNVVVEYGGGLFGGIFWAAFGAAAAAAARVKKLPVSKGQIAVFAVAELFCLTPLFCANRLLCFLAALFSMLLMLYVIIGVRGAKLFGKSFVRDFFISVARPFAEMISAPAAMFSLFKGRRQAKNILIAIAGVLVALPLTLVVGMLLMCSDNAFENVMSGFLEHQISAQLVWKTIWGIPVGMLLFGAVISLSSRHDLPDDIAPSCRVIPPVGALSAVTPICLLYVLYFFVQLGDFTSALRGIVPDGYSSISDYARRGFFELCAVAAINLGVIAILQAFTKRKENDVRPFSLKLYTVVISVFTLLQIGSAISKMLLYISVRGMTQLRIYTSWFMLTMAVAFVLIILLQFREYPFWKVMFTVFVLMFGVLCFGNVDGNIARYNVNAYLDGRLSAVDVSYLSELGTAAAKPAAKLLGRLPEDEDNTSHQLADSLAYMLAEIEERSSIAYFNLADFGAESALADAGMIYNSNGTVTYTQNGESVVLYETHD